MIVWQNTFGFACHKTNTTDEVWGSYNRCDTFSSTLEYKYTPWRYWKQSPLKHVYLYTNQYLCHTTEEWNLKKKYGHFLWPWQHKFNTIRWMWITTWKLGLAKWYNTTLCTLLLNLTYGSGFNTAIRMLLHMCYTFWILATVSSFYLASNDRFTNSNAPLRHTWWQKQIHF